MSNTSTAAIPYLDGWRGLAIIGVFLGHFIFGYGWLGNFGVQMFFALSGYLMAHLLFIKKTNLQDFFARRLARVVPTFLLFVAVMYVYAATLQPVPYAVPGSELLATTLFLRTYLPSDMSIWTTPWPIGHLWSLNVEEHSYLFLAVGAFLAGRAKGSGPAIAFLVASVLLVIAFCLYYPGNPPAGAAPWYARSECAALGLIAATAIRVIRHSSPYALIKGVPRLMPLLWVVIAVACISTYKHRGGQYIIAPLCLALAVNYLDCVPDLVKTALSNGVLRWFGKCSFSLYLWQQPFFILAHKSYLPPLVAAVLGVAVGALSFYAFENPLRIKLNSAWSNWRLSKQRSLQAS